ncbi:MAG: ammonium transporter [Bacteroidota bacterium]
MMNTGDTAWVLVATAMVMLMTPAGLALFYGGLSSKKSVINTVGMSYAAFCVATLAWVVLGYSIAFGDNVFSHVLLRGIGIDDLAGSIPTLLFVAFQGVFAAIAVAIVSGSVEERMKFSSWIVFTLFWVLLVYAPLVRAIWGDAIFGDLGELDFAGGTVIHVNAGIAGLVLAVLLGKRKRIHETSPSSIKLTVLGSALLWFGWFGFNAGSQLAADGVAANALLVTNIAACAGAVAWMLFEWCCGRKPSTLGLASGAISGLVGITPAAGYVDSTGALLIGLTSGLIGYFGVIKLKKVFDYDDSLDAFGIHGLVGIWGSIATAFFAHPDINGASGVLFGNTYQLLPQVAAVLFTVVYATFSTWGIFWLTERLTGGSRIDSKTELEGLDQAYHNETSFAR